MAAKIGKDPDTLEKTVNTWNKSCADGNDPEFGRNPKRMAPIQTPPFYAAEFVPAFTNTQGGPRRNSKAQVLDTYRKPIPRLYSADELGALYSWHYQGEGNILECLVFGRIAGERARCRKVLDIIDIRRHARLLRNQQYEGIKSALDFDVLLPPSGRVKPHCILVSKVSISRTAPFLLLI